MTDALSTLFVDDLVLTFFQFDERATTSQRIVHALRKVLCAAHIEASVFEKTASVSPAWCCGASCRELEGDVEKDTSAKMQVGSTFPLPARALADSGTNWLATADGVFLSLRLELSSEMRTTYVMASADCGAVAEDAALLLDTSATGVRLFASAVRAVHALEHARLRELARTSFRRQLDAILLGDEGTGRSALGRPMELLVRLEKFPEMLAAGDVATQLPRLAGLILNRVLQAPHAFAPEVLVGVADALQRVSASASLSAQAGEDLQATACCLRALLDGGSKQ